MFSSYDTTVDVGSTINWLRKARRVSTVLPVSTQSEYLIKRFSRIPNVGFAWICKFGLNSEFLI